MWHFYEGHSLTLHMLSPDGEYTTQQVGMDLDTGALPQYTVPAGYWFASEIKETNAYALAGCTVSPRFDFNDFELAKAGTLIKKYPQNTDIIRRLCR